MIKLKIHFLYLLASIFFEQSVQWIELNEFECYHYTGQNLTSLSDLQHTKKQNCYKAKNSNYYMGCLTILNPENGLFYGGCYDMVDWKYRFLCVDRRGRDFYYNLELDKIGLNLYNYPFAFCCKEPMCNSPYKVNTYRGYHDQTVEALWKKYNVTDFIIKMLVFAAVGTIAGIYAKNEDEEKRIKAKEEIDKVAEYQAKSKKKITDKKK